MAGQKCKQSDQRVLIAQQQKTNAIKVGNVFWLNTLIHKCNTSYLGLCIRRYWVAESLNVLNNINVLSSIKIIAFYLKNNFSEKNKESNQTNDARIYSLIFYVQKKIFWFFSRTLFTKLVCDFLHLIQSNILVPDVP